VISNMKLFANRYNIVSLAALSTCVIFLCSAIATGQQQNQHLRIKNRSTLNTNINNQNNKKKQQQTLQQFITNLKRQLILLDSNNNKDEHFFRHLLFMNEKHQNYMYNVTVNETVCMKCQTAAVVVQTSNRHLHRDLLPVDNNTTQLCTTTITTTTSATGTKLVTKKKSPIQCISDTHWYYLDKFLDSRYNKLYLLLVYQL
jgi:hypothetical protein